VYPDQWFFENFEKTKFKTGIQTRCGTGCKNPFNSGSSFLNLNILNFWTEVIVVPWGGVQPFVTFHIPIVKSYFSNVHKKAL
jgi:hypothetical protein